MDIRPILSALRRHKTAASLIVLQIALSCAIICNALFLIGGRIERMDRPTGLADEELVRVRATSIGPNENRDAQAIIRSIVSLGMGLGVTITAEGVETEAELSCLRAEGCHEGQGFLFSRARPHAEIVALMQAQRGLIAAGGKDRAA